MFLKPSLLQKPVIILGIDPGTLLMGYSVIEAYKNTLSIKVIDVLKLSSKKDHYQRLQLVHQKITELVEQYSPRKIKQSITGNGNADKEQVWKMLQRITALPDKPKYYDATDALAVAICHFYGSNSMPGKKTTGTKKSSGWEKFVQQNPERVLKMR